MTPLDAPPQSTTPLLWPTVSVIIPTRNEGRYIGQCLDSVLSGEYPLDRLELIVVDAMSTDQTRDVIRARAGNIPLRILDDCEGNLPRALNLAILDARGDILIRLDGHNIYAPDYLRRCVERLVAGEADMVGGVWHVTPRSTGGWGRAVAAVLGEPFGVGNAHYRTHTFNEPTETDTVPYFACYRSLFDRFGLYDESVPGSEDMVYNSQLRQNGGRILLDPSIQSWYQARTDPSVFIRHNLRNGYWAILPLYWGKRFRARHFAPLAFVTGLILLAGLGTASPTIQRVFVAAVLAYLATALAVSMRAAVRGRAPLNALLMPPAFAVLHVTYGIGSLAGVLVLLWKAVWPGSGPPQRHGAKPVTGA
jgi:succinoglycan biosynthesis protein ExoA